MVIFFFDKVTTGTYNFVPVIWHSNPVGVVIAGIILTKTKFLYQVKINSFSQLMNGTFRVLEKLLKCFNGTTISV